MPWHPPRTWVTGELVTATHMNEEIRDNWIMTQWGSTGPVWNDFAVTIRQPGSIAKTTNYARWFKTGKIVHAQLFVTITGTGTAATAVLIDLPWTPAFASLPLEIGTATLFDSSANLAYKGNVIMNSTPGANIRASGTSTGVLGTTDFTAALANNDTISLTVTYESST